MYYYRGETMNDLIVYTAAFGDHITVMPQKKFEGVDFICFTDVPRKVKGWEMRMVKPEFANDNTRNNRYYKILPHRFFGEYKKSIYIDSNFIVMDLPADHFTSQLEITPMLTFDHSQTKADPRDCVYEEHEALMHLYKAEKVKDDPAQMQKHIEFLKEQNYPSHNGLIVGSVLIRNHHHPKVSETMEAWWQMVLTMSKRDQLSFNYVAWKTGLPFGYLSGDSRRGNPYFYHAGKNDKYVVYSVLKYKLRKLLHSL